MVPRQKVLIVEDNADVRRLYAIGLNQHGFEVKLAANGAEALDRIASEKPDVILLDLMMPVMNGWELIARVNPTEQGAYIPVVVVTGVTAPAEKSHPCVVGWLSKPATIEEVVRMIHDRIDGAGPSIIPTSGQPGPNQETSAAS